MKIKTHRIPNPVRPSQSANGRHFSRGLCPECARDLGEIGIIDQEILGTEVSPGACWPKGDPGAVYKTLSLLVRQRLKAASSTLDAHTPRMICKPAWTPGQGLEKSHPRIRPEVL